MRYSRFPLAALSLAGFVFASAAAGCAPKRFGHTRIVDPAAFEKSPVLRMAFLGGDTLKPDIQDRILDALTARYRQVAKPGSVFSRETVRERIPDLQAPKPPDPRKVLAEGAVFGDAPGNLAVAIRDKVGADAFYVVWVVEWSGTAIRPRLPSDPDDPNETSEIRREMVIQIFEAGTGRELWHTVWKSGFSRVAVRLLSEEACKKALDQEIAQVVEDVWARFWLG